MNWDVDTVPVSAAGTSLVFGGTGVTSYTATHDLVSPFTLNSLVLQSDSLVEQTLAAAAGETLNFISNGATLPSVIQNGTGAFTVSLGITAATALQLGGSGSGTTHFAGVVGGDGGLNFTGGAWRLSNNANTMKGGLTIGTGALLELAPVTGPTLLSRAGTAALLGSPSNALVVNGGTMKVTTQGAMKNSGDGGHISFGNFALTFGAQGGTLDLTNTNPSDPAVHAGSIGWRNALDQNQTGGDLALTLSNTATAVARFNGGEAGYASLDLTKPEDWSIGAGNVLRFRSIAGSGPMRIELTNGATARAGATTMTTVSISAPTTYRGVAGGDPTSGPLGFIDTGITRSVGKIAVNVMALTYSGGLILEDGLQVHATGGGARLAGGITLAGASSGHPAHVSFSGRATGNNLNEAIRSPGEASSNGHYVLALGTSGSTALTIQDGAIGVFDARMRKDAGVDNHSGVYLDGNAILEAGGVLRIAQSLSNFSPIAGIFQGASVGDIILAGAMHGQGSTAKEAVLDLRLPAPSADGTKLNGVPTPLTATSITEVGARPFGGLVANEAHQIIISGSGFGGLRVEANARPDSLFSTTGFPGSPMPDPVSNLTKVESYLTAARLAGMTGSGGYLTPAPIGQTWFFPIDGEWAPAVTVGLRATNHHPGGADVYLGQLNDFQHNLAVDAGAVVDLGGSPFTFGPLAATPGLGTLHGNGTVLSAGGFTVAAGGRLAPGMGDVGTLMVDQVHLAGGLEIEANAAAADLLNVVGSMVLDASSQLIVTSVLGPRNYKIAVAGERAGTFGSTSGLPATHSVSYTRPGEVWLSYSGARDITWVGNLTTTWDKQTQNWSGSTAFADGDQVTFDDSALPARRIVDVAGGDVAPTSISVNTSGDYSLISTPGSAIVGFGELVKTGTGTLTLSGPASFEGGVLIQEGVLQTFTPHSIPDAGKVVVSAGAQLNLGAVETIDELIVSGAVSSSAPLTVQTLTLQDAAAFNAPLILEGKVIKSGSPLVIPQTIDLAGGMRTIQVAAGTSPELTLAAAVSNGGLTKSGPGTLLLSAANNFAGGLVAQAGTVRPSVAGAIPANSNVTVAAAGTVDLNGIAHTLGALESSGAVTTGGAPLTVSSLSGLGGSLDLGAAPLQVNQGIRSRYDGAITTTGTLTKAGPGSLALGGSNSIGGGIQITEGIVRIESDTAAVTGTVSVPTGGTLVAGATIGAPIVLAGGTFGASHEDPAATGDVTAAAGTTSVLMIADPEEPAQQSELVITGRLRGSGNLVIQASSLASSADRGQGMRLRGTETSDFSGTITVGPHVKFELQSSVAGPFSPAGSGSIVLTAGTNFSGRFGSYSQLNLRNNHRGDTILGTNVVVTGSGLVNFGPVSDPDPLDPGNGLAPEDSQIVLGNLTIGDGQIAAVNKNAGVPQVVTFSTVTLTGGNAVFSPNTPGFGFNAGSDLALGAISELAPGSGIVMAGSDNLFLAGNNTYTGATAILSGKTWLSGANALPATTALDVGSAATLLFESPLGSSFSQTVASLSGAPLAVITNSTDEVRDFTVNQSGDTVFAGSIQGNLNLVKSGGGTLHLAGINSHRGTTVAGGALSVSSGGVQGAITGSVIVQDGARLLGHGSVGALTVQSGGRIEPGEGLGILSTEALTFDSGSVAAFELAGTVPGGSYDQIGVLEDVVLNGLVTLELQLGYQPAISDELTLILNGGNEPILGGGRFVYGGNVLENGEIFAVSTGMFQQAFEIHYDGNDGNDVVLTAVPEPSSAFLLLGGLALLARRRRV